MAKNETRGSKAKTRAQMMEEQQAAKKRKRTGTRPIEKNHAQNLDVLYAEPWPEAVRVKGSEKILWAFYKAYHLQRNQQCLPFPQMLQPSNRGKALNLADIPEKIRNDMRMDLRLTKIGEPIAHFPYEIIWE